jgi:hypothetical protein
MEVPETRLGYVLFELGQLEDVATALLHLFAKRSRFEEAVIACDKAIHSEWRSQFHSTAHLSQGKDCVGEVVQ